VRDDGLPQPSLHLRCVFPRVFAVPRDAEIHCRHNDGSKGELSWRSVVGRTDAKPTPPGFPAALSRRVALLEPSCEDPSCTEDWPMRSLRGHANGATVECLLDADAGTLCFTVNDGPLCFGLGGFPQGVPLRPWAYLFCPDEDRVTISDLEEWTPRLGEGRVIVAEPLLF
jgi:hypothetical protein